MHSRDSICLCVVCFIQCSLQHCMWAYWPKNNQLRKRVFCSLLRINFLWVENWIELNRDSDVRSSSPFPFIPHLHCCISLTNLCECDCIHSFLALWLIASRATPQASRLIHLSVRLCAEMCVSEKEKWPTGAGLSFSCCWRWLWFSLLRGGDAPAY